METRARPSQSHAEPTSGTPPSKKGPRGIPDNQRLTAMSDGVFAIVITLLVFSIKIPEIAPERAIQELPQALLKITPDLLTLVISFIVMGIYWIGHNNVFLHVIHHDRFLLWLNIVFLLSVALIPYPTSLLVRYGQAQLSSVLYAANLLVGGVLLDVIWWYANRDGHLVCETVQPQLVTSFHRRILAGPCVYLISIGASFVSITAAKLLFVAAAVFYLIPTTQDLFHHRQLNAQDY